MDAAVAMRRWPERVEVDWRRFSCGLWRVPEGDIHAACRLESFPKARTFQCQGQLYVPCGMHFYGSLETEAMCHPIIRPGDYCGPEPEERGYEGRSVIVKRETFRLGPRVVFKSSDPTVFEWRQHLKILYADGGVFASKPSYAEFLDSLKRTEAGHQAEALQLERTDFGNRDKKSIREILVGREPSPLAQLDFSW